MTWIVDICGVPVPEPDDYSEMRAGMLGYLTGVSFLDVSLTQTWDGSVNAVFRLDRPDAVEAIGVASWCFGVSAAYVDGIDRFRITRMAVYAETGKER